MDYLSDKEKNAVQRFIADEHMREAVRKVLLSGVYYDGIMTPDKPADPLKNFLLGYFSSQQMALLPVEEKGKKVEVILNAISMVETGFKELEKFKEIKVEEKEKINKAR